MATLPLTDHISQQSRRTVKFSTLSAKFGDGYEQTAPDGTNPRVESWSVVLENLTAAERATAWAFLDSVGFSTAWTWTPPGDTTSKLFKVREGIDESFSAGNIYTISFNCEQVFGV